MRLCIRCDFIKMSEPYPIGLRYFLSDSFDNLFKSWASPIKVAFTAGLVIGLGLGYSGRRIRDRAAKAASGVHEQLKWHDDPLQIPLDFKQAEEKMRDMVSSYFPNSNGLFSQLKESMNCQTEIEGSNIEALKEAVVPDNSKLTVALFYSTIVKFLEGTGLEKNDLNQLNKEANGLSRLCFDADMLLMYAEDNSELASKIRTYANSKTITVDLHEEIGAGQPKLSSLDNVFERYIYVCIIVTKELKKDVLEHFRGEVCHVNSLYNARGRLIPVLIKGREPEYISHSAYNTLKPLKYDPESTSWTQLESLIQNANKTLFIQTNK